MNTAAEPTTQPIATEEPETIDMDKVALQGEAKSIKLVSEEEYVAMKAAYKKRQGKDPPAVALFFKGPAARRYGPSRWRLFRLPYLGP